LIFPQLFTLNFVLFLIGVGFSYDIQFEILKSDSLYENGEHNKSFSIIKRIYNNNANNPDVVFRMARSIFLKAQNEKNKKKQIQYYYKGLKQAEKALRLDPYNGYANFWYAAYLGRIGELEGTKQAILNSYEVKKYALIAIDLEPECYSAHHMMGRWHYELANLNEFEKKIASIVYTRLPEGSYSEAISFFEKAIQIKPNEIRHHFWLAKTYYAIGDKKLSEYEFNVVNNLIAKDNEDREFQSESRKYLESF
tara:strand:- start:1371 stop:2126 length:756 start_codon:yes stop_codon:yes gene_type:complete